MQRVNLRKLNSPEKCPECGKHTLNRTEIVGKVAIILFVVTFPFVRIALQDNGNGPEPWLIRVVPDLVWQILIIAFGIAIFAFGYHAYYDRTHSFKCRTCGFKMNRPAPPYTWVQKTIIAITVASAMIVFAMLGVLLAVKL